VCLGLGLVVCVCVGFCFFFFFFQAEDGIRDLIVTGVQTCALPIFRRRSHRRPGLLGTVEVRVGGERRPAVRTTPEAIDLQRTLRSEERRVGKSGGPGGRRNNKKKKKETEEREQQLKTNTQT